MALLRTPFALPLALLSMLLSVVGWLLRAVFGELHWRRPLWLDSLIGLGAGAAGWARAHPARALALAATLAALGAGGWAGYRWWQARPKPVEIVFEVSAPARTDIENGGNPNPLMLSFSGSVAPLAKVGKVLTAGIAMRPELAGEWRWTDDRTLSFQPKADWPVGQSYEVTLDKTLVAPQIRLAQYGFAFSSPAFEMSVTSSEFYQDPVNPGLKKAVIALAFSHPVDPASLEKRITLQMAGASGGVLGLGAEKTPFVVSYDKLKLAAFIHSQALPIPKDAARLDARIEAGVQAARGGTPSTAVLEQAVAIPGLYSLTVSAPEATVATDDRNEPQQVLVLGTSGAVNERDMQRAVRAWVLPVRHANQHADDKAPYGWPATAEVTDAVLKASTPLALTPNPAEREHTDIHSFRYRADVGRHVFVQVEKGLKSFGGYLLGERQHFIVRVPPFPSELKILSQGALLSMSGDKKVAVLVRDLPGVQVELGRVLPGQLQHLISQSEGAFATPEFYGSFGEDNLVERQLRKVPLTGLARGKAHYEAVDLGAWLGSGKGDERRGVFLLTVRGYDPEPGARPRPEYRPEDCGSEEEGGCEGMDGEMTEETDPSQRVDKRLIVVTDLGLIAKRELDGTQRVFVQSIASGEPVAGATVDVVARNGVTLFSETSDAQGMVRFPKLEGLAREQAPMMFLVRKAGDLSFLPLGRYDRMLDVSRFDVGGVANARSAGQLQAYLFSDRGIYRPGDTFNIGLIVKAANWGRPEATPLEGLPLEAEVLDARGLVVRRERIRLGAAGFNELAHTTLETSPTGTWHINLYTVKDGRPHQQLGGTTVKVQEFQPDRMKASVRLSSEVAEGWVHPKALSATVRAMNLFGTPAENRRVTATLTLSPAFPAFRSHPDYSFYDPLRAKEGYSEQLADGQTDAQGEARFDLGLAKYSKASYRVHLLARAFEAEGGRSVAAETSTLVSELPFLIGFKADGPLDHVSRGTARAVSLIAIDPHARKTEARGLKLALVERKFVSMLVKQNSGLFRYESRRKEVTLKEQDYSIPVAGASLALPTDTAGNYAWVLRDADGLELNRVEFGVAGQGNVTRSLERNAELQLTLDRKDYAPGDEIEIGIRAPYTGAGLITIERDKVYAQHWFKTDSVSSVQKITLPRDFEGNGYVSVQFVRDPASDEIFMSPLSHGVVPFATSLSARTERLRLSAPETLKPGQTLRIRLGSGEPARAVVFAVDEGILQVARYKNADPLADFFRKRALEVRTSQILDMILPEFRKLMAAAAPGGDEAGAAGRHLNPFKRKRDKPVAWWSGIVELKAGEREFSYTVPESFNGSLRVMAVSVSDTRIGTASVQSQVRGDFVLSPNLPLAVSPGDEFEISVGVANNVAGSGKEAPVQLALALPPQLELLGPATQTLRIGELREGVATYRVKAREGAAAKLGSASLAFTASLGARSARLASDISVRPASPLMSVVTAGSFKGTLDLPVSRTLHGEYRVAEAALSPVPLVVAGGLTQYLATFPHACTEQLVSQTLPGLVLAKRPDFATASARPRGKALDETLRVLRGRQNQEGGFGLWAASVEADPFASVYATHLLVEAREAGQPVPQDMLQRALDHLQQLAASPARSLHEARVRAYAAWLLTRQGVVTTPILASLRQTLDATQPGQWRNDLAAGYLAASYQLLKQDRTAAELIAPLATALGERKSAWRFEAYYDPMIRDAATLYLLARHFPERARALPPDTMLAMVRSIQAGQYNTLSSAYTVLALDAWAGLVGRQGAGKLMISELDAQGRARPLVLPDTLVPRVPFGPGAAKLRFSGDGPLPLYYAVTESGFDRSPPATDLKKGLEIIREYVDAKGNPVKSVRVGDELTVRVRLRAIDRPQTDHVAVVDLLPGGFEPVIEPPAPVAEGEAPAVPAFGRGSWTPHYTDVREDRVLLYGSASQSLTEYSYRVKATNAGRFTVPPAYAESMYERDLQARSAAGQIVVEKASK